MEYRKFNPNTAITGDKYLNYNNTCIWLGRAASNDVAPNIVELLCTDGKSCRLAYAPDDELFQIPLCIIEDKPVYEGDTLYVNDIRRYDQVVGIDKDRILFRNSGPCMIENPRKNLTWKAPKVKKSGWINIYRMDDGSTKANTCSEYLYKTKELAIDNAMTDVIDTIEIHWEE